MKNNTPSWAFIILWLIFTISCGVYLFTGEQHWFNSIVISGLTTTIIGISEILMRL